MLAIINILVKLEWYKMPTHLKRNWEFERKFLTGNWIHHYENEVHWSSTYQLKFTKNTKQVWSIIPFVPCSLIPLHTPHISYTAIRYVFFISNSRGEKQEQEPPKASKTKSRQVPELRVQFLIFNNWLFELARRSR